MTSQLTNIINESISVIDSLNKSESDELYILNNLLERIQLLSAKDKKVVLNAVNTRFNANWTLEDLNKAAAKFKQQASNSPSLINKEGAVNMSTVNAADHVPAEPVVPAPGVQPAAAAPAQSSVPPTNAGAGLSGSVENSWLQPKYMAAAGALVGTVASIAAGQELTIGAGVGGVAAVAVSYYGADYLFSEIEMLNGMGGLTRNVLASALGVGVGATLTRAGGMIEGKLLGGKVETQADASNAIPSPTAEAEAWF